MIQKHRPSARRREAGHKWRGSRRAKAFQTDGEEDEEEHEKASEGDPRNLSGALLPVEAAMRPGPAPFFLFQLA